MIYAIGFAGLVLGLLIGIAIGVASVSSSMEGY